MPSGKRKSWSEAAVRDEAVGYKTKWEFEKGCGSACKAARRLGIIDDLGFINVHESWAEEKVRAAAANYSTKKAFEDGHPAAYEACLRLKLIDELFDNQRQTWNLQTLKVEAAKYPGKIEFKRGNGTAYRAATRLGVMDQLGFTNKQFSWTEDKAREAAKKYLTATDFMRGDIKGCGACQRFRILDDLEFKLRNSADNNAIYIWRAVDQYFNGDPLYKIGVTSARLGEARIKQCARNTPFEFDLVCCEPITCKATDLEKRLLLLGGDPEFVGFDGATEFRSMSDAVLWVALGLISEVAMGRNL